MIRSEWQFCHKRDFFRLMDEQVIPSHPTRFHLKYIQDIFALGEINKLLEESENPDNLVIGEIGANHSRVLPDLAKSSRRLFAIDVYDRSIGGGSTKRPDDKSYEILECLVGDSASTIKSEFFDILFSISVVEHVPKSSMADFLLDHDRILKKGGAAIHLIDFYCDANSSPFGAPKDLTDGFRQIDSSFDCSIKDWSFKTSFCTNDDYTMWLWNKSSPGLAGKRNTMQSCTFIVKIYKD